MKRKYITFIGCIVILLFCFVLYLIESNSNKQNDLTQLKVAEVTHSVFYAPQYIAIANHYFEEEGLEIELILTPGVKSFSVFKN